jgi:hypothetical protein
VDTTSPYRPKNRSRAAIAALAVWLVLTALIMLAIASTGFTDVQVQFGPTPRYDYCTREWRQQNLPPDMQAQFTDWCEQRPGR